MAPPQRIHLLHLSAWRESLGGLQSVLRQHRDLDAQLGFSNSFLSFFDRTNSWTGDAATLSARGGKRLGTIVKRFEAACAGRDCEVAIYHDGWGIEWFAGREGAKRRIMYLHTERPHAEVLFSRQLPYFDGVFSMSEACLARVRRAAPAYPEERLFAIPYKIEAPASLPPKDSKDGTPGRLRLGYAGRLEKGHKRLDRLAPLLALLADSSFEWSFDLIGDGAYLPQLKRQFAGDSRVRFLGLLSGDSYWKALSQLDALVFLSDYEGTSRAALEGMCVGVAPVYPDFSPASKELLGPLSPRLLYPTGDMGCAAAKISTLAGLAPQERLALSSELLARTERHRDGTYERGFAEFVRRVLSLPAIGKRSVLSPSLSWMPLGLYTRLFPKHF